MASWLGNNGSCRKGNECGLDLAVLRSGLWLDQCSTLIQKCLAAVLVFLLRTCMSNVVGVA